MPSHEGGSGRSDYQPQQNIAQESHTLSLITIRPRGGVEVTYVLSPYYHTSARERPKRARETQTCSLILIRPIALRAVVVHQQIPYVHTFSCSLLSMCDPFRVLEKTDMTT
jgi:hypothetical protein